jgi:hypothetical protein
MPDRPNIDVRLAAVKLFFRHRLSLLPSKLRIEIPAPAAANSIRNSGGAAII